MLPAERRGADGAPLGVHDTRYAEPDAEERPVGGGRVDPGLQHVGNPVDRVARRCVELELEALEDVGVEVDDHADEVIGRDLHAERRRGAADELQQHGGAPASRRRVLGDADDPAVEQLAGQRGHGRRAEAEHLRDVRPGDRAGSADQAENGHPVEVSRKARGARPESPRVPHRTRHCSGSKFISEQKSSVTF